PERYDDGGSEADAHECPLLAAMCHRLTAGCSGNSGLASGSDINIKKRTGHHADPARKHVRPELHAGKTVKVIAEIKRNYWTEAKEENQFGALSADGIVDVAKLFVPFRDRFDSVSRNEPGDETGQRRAESRARRNGQTTSPRTTPVSGAKL